jgi:hypothetical protein
MAASVHLTTDKSDKKKGAQGQHPLPFFSFLFLAFNTALFFLLSLLLFLFPLIRKLSFSQARISLVFNCPYHQAYLYNTIFRELAVSSNISFRRDQAAQQTAWKPSIINFVEQRSASSYLDRHHGTALFVGVLQHREARNRVPEHSSVFWGPS